MKPEVTRTRTHFAKKVDVTGELLVELWSRGADCTSPLTWSTVSNSSLPVKTVGKYEWMCDTVVPDFYRRSKRGEVFFNRLIHDTVDVSAGFGTAAGEIISDTTLCSSSAPYQQAYRRTFSGLANMGSLHIGMKLSDFISPSGGVISPASLLSGADVSRLATEVSTCVQDKRGRAAFNMGEDLATWRQAAGTLGGVAQSIGKVLQSRTMLGKLRGASSAYLIYRYGIKPLMSDCEEAYKAVLKATNDFERVTTRCNGSLSTNSESVQYHKGPYFGAWYGDENVTIQDSVVVRAMSLDEQLKDMANALGLSLKDLITLPWELLPYSFVLDWFVNLGEYIGSLVPAFGLRQLGSCMVYDYTTVLQKTVFPSDAITGWHWGSKAGVFGQQVLYTRKLREPGLVSRDIVIKSDFRFDQLTRLGDAVALVIQKLKPFK